MEEIAAGKSKKRIAPGNRKAKAANNRNKNRNSTSNKTKPKPRRRAQAAAAKAERKRARHSPGGTSRQPGFVAPSLAKPHDAAAHDAERNHEIEFDGDRIGARRDHGNVKMQRARDPDKDSIGRSASSASSASPGRRRRRRNGLCCGSRRARLQRRAARQAPNRGKQGADVANVHLTHPDRVYWVDVGVTKEDLAEYYVSVWDVMAPQLVDRPLAIVRCPAGTAGECFFQKHIAGNIKQSPLRHVVDAKEHDVIAVAKLDDLIALVQSGALGNSHPRSQSSTAWKYATASYSISIQARACPGRR